MSEEREIRNQFFGGGTDVHFNVSVGKLPQCFLKENMVLNADF